MRHSRARIYIYVYMYIFSLFACSLPMCPYHLAVGHCCAGRWVANAGHVHALTVKGRTTAGLAATDATGTNSGTARTKTQHTMARIDENSPHSRLRGILRARSGGGAASSSEPRAGGGGAGGGAGERRRMHPAPAAAARPPQNGNTHACARAITATCGRAKPFH